MKNLLLVLILCLLFGCTSTSDQLSSNTPTTPLGSDTITVLKSNYKNATTDSLKIIALDRISEWYLEHKQLDSTLKYSKKTIYEFRDSVYTVPQAFRYYKISDVYRSKGEIGNQISIVNTLQERLSSDAQPAAKAILLQLQFHKLLDEDNYTQAETFGEERLQFLEDHALQKELQEAQLHQAQLLFMNLGKREKAFAILDGLKKNTSISNDIGRQLYGNYGVYKYFEEKKQECLENYLKGLEYAKKMDANAIDKTNLLAPGYLNITEVLIDLKRPLLAKKYLDTLQILDFTHLEDRLQRSALKYELRLQTEFNTTTANAAQFLDTIFKYRDVAYKEKYTAELEDLTRAKEVEKKLAIAKERVELDNLKLRSRLVTTAAVLTLLVLLAFGFYWYKKRQQEQKALLMQQRLLRAQMNPHFTFNALYSIQSLFKVNPETGSKYLNSFSRLLRLTLENSVKNYIPLEDEIESIEKYIELQQIRFPDRFISDIEYVDLEPDEVAIPPMLIQPFVENAIEHGFGGITYTGVLKITLSRKQNKVYCSIEDNGKGIQDTQSVKNSTSVKLISAFVLKKTGTSLNISENTQISKHKGVHVTFELPYKSLIDD